MKKTSGSILVGLALIGLFSIGPAGGAEVLPANVPVATRTMTQAALSAEADLSGTAVAPSGQLQPLAADSTEILPDQSVFLDGSAWGGCAFDSCCAVCGGGEWCPPDWYTDQEVRILTRNRPRHTLTSAELQVDSGISVLEERLTSRSTAFDVAAGYSIILGHYLGRDTENRDRFIEFNYWGLNDWSESRLVNGTRFTDSGSFDDPVNFGSLFTPFGITTNVYDTPIGGFNRADQHRIIYESDIDNFELNLRFRPRAGSDRLVLHPNGRWRRECQPGRYVSYLVGARVLTVDETFELHSRGEIISGDVSSDVSGDYYSNTFNNLVGLQFGAELMQQNCKYGWGFRAKAGPYINIASYNVRAINNADGDPFASTSIDFRRNDGRDDVAFIGEVGVVGTYRFRPNLVLRASYDLMWVIGLAMAPDQLAFEIDPPAELNADATGYYHGLTLGFEWTR